MDMQTDIYWFNPENDMALANFTPYYRPPSEIIRMRQDLELLPVWYAPPGSRVRVESLSLAQAFIASLSERGISVSCSCMDVWAEASYHPWGWNPSLLFQLRGAGVSAGCLPSDSRLEHLRALSGRHSAVPVLTQLAALPGTCGESFTCDSVEEVERHLRQGEVLVLKSPWSGSGRGVMKVSLAGWNESLRGWVSHILRTQHSIQIEPFYQKVEDFAMEFYADGKGRVRFLGYSLFETDEYGNYKGNLLLSDEMILARLSRYVGQRLLETVRDRLLALLEELLKSDYEGYLGVDMMVCACEEMFLLHPCVEINLRMNMGVVAHCIYERWIDAASCGKYRIEYYREEGEALHTHQELTRRFPLRMSECGKIRQGYLSLTPVTSSTRYQAYIVIE